MLRNNIPFAAGKKAKTTQIYYLNKKVAKNSMIYVRECLLERLQGK